MFKKEEDKLVQFTKGYHGIPVPTELLDDAVTSGFTRAKQQETAEKGKKNRVFMSSVAAAVLLFGFLASIRISPAFASYVSSLPGMEKVVEIIGTDKGLMAAVENNYIQKVNLSDQHSGLKITLDSVIADQEQMAVFLTVKNTGSHKSVNITSPNLKTTDGKHLMGAAGYDTMPKNLQQTESFTSRIEFVYEDPLPSKKLVFTVEAEEGALGGEARRKLPGVFTYSFSLNKKMDQNKKRLFALNKTVTVENQRITVKDVSISPIRTSVHLLFDTGNSKKIFYIEDLRLVDEHGETWSGVNNGISGSYPGDDEQIVYLQSNYFKKPNKLFLQFNKVRALNKNELNVIYDPKTQKIIKSPSDGKIKGVVTTPNEFIMKIQTKHIVGGAESVVLNAKGNNIGKGGMGISVPAQDKQLEIYYSYDPKKLIPGPVTFPLYDYPAHIKGKVKIKIKIK